VFEAAVVAVLGYQGQRAPFLIGEAGNGDPAIQRSLPSQR
jgi:hypothetical protein